MWRKIMIWAVAIGLVLLLVIMKDDQNEEPPKQPKAPHKLSQRGDDRHQAGRTTRTPEATIQTQSEAKQEAVPALRDETE